MIDLNFINPEEQIEMHKEKIILVVRDVFAFLVITTALVSSVMLVGRNIMQESIADITDSSTLVKIQENEINVAIKRINTRLKNIDTLQKQYQVWTPTLASITSTIPANNQLTSFVLDTETRVIQVKGISKTRESLLALKSSLESDGHVASVDLPISNLLSKEDIEFSLTIHLKNLEE